MYIFIFGDYINLQRGREVGVEAHIFSSVHTVSPFKAYLPPPPGSCPIIDKGSQAKRILNGKETVVYVWRIYLQS